MRRAAKCSPLVRCAIAANDMNGFVDINSKKKKLSPFRTLSLHGKVHRITIYFNCFLIYFFLIYIYIHYCVPIIGFLQLVNSLTQEFKYYYSYYCHIYYCNRYVCVLKCHITYTIMRQRMFSFTRRSNQLIRKYGASRKTLTIHTS
jgi:hypothetical protein